MQINCTVVKCGLLLALLCVFVKGKSLPSPDYSRQRVRRPYTSRIRFPNSNGYLRPDRRLSSKSVIYEAIGGYPFGSLGLSGSLGGLGRLTPGYSGLGVLGGYGGLGLGGGMYSGLFSPYGRLQPLYGGLGQGSLSGLGGLQSIYGGGLQSLGLGSQLGSFGGLLGLGSIGRLGTYGLGTVPGLSGLSGGRFSALGGFPDRLTGLGGLAGGSLYHLGDRSTEDIFGLNRGSYEYRKNRNTRIRGW